MILSDSAILTAIEKGDIVISPFERSQLGSNSYDVRLGSTLKVYDINGMDFDKQGQFFYIDAKKDNPTYEIEIPEDGFILMPNELYLGSTVEYTETHNLVPFLEGKSSTGRLGISVHATAGKGDAGFCGHWTLEIRVEIPVKIYPNMPIAQLIYFPTMGNVLQDYASKPNAKYANQGAKPVGSQMFKNFK
jgi:dCTP deaminase